jgi:adenosyl cobinamide kinase/adenosyl cobinamide phosphate guanylyltransferase
MEVHHHPDVHHKKKKFREYFLEFLMIFLAVTMGFFAESMRENISDHKKEKEFMQSLVRDIKDDTAILNSQQKTFQERVVLLDSLVIALNANSFADNTSNIYYYGRMATKIYAFPANTRTIDQIKSTGGFRVIKNNNIVADMMSYYALIGSVHELDATDEEEMNEYRKIAVQVFSAVVFNNINSSSLDIVTRPVDNPPLRTSDKKLLGDLAGWSHYMKNTRIGIYQYKKEVLSKAEKLIQLIQKEYHLEND